MELITSLLSGGATGLLGLGLQSLFGWLSTREKNKHERAMAEEDRKMVALEGENAARIAEVKREEASDTASGEVHRESYRMEPKRYAQGERPTGAVGTAGWFMLTLVDVLRGSIRPGLTIWLAWIANELRKQAEAILLKTDVNLHAQVIVGTYEHIVWTLCYLFSTCVTWWFGTRLKDFVKAMKK